MNFKPLAQFSGPDFFLLIPVKHTRSYELQWYKNLLKKHFVVSISKLLCRTTSQFCQAEYGCCPIINLGQEKDEREKIINTIILQIVSKNSRDILLLIFIYIEMLVSQSKEQIVCVLLKHNSPVYSSLTYFCTLVGLDV